MVPSIHPCSRLFPPSDSCVRPDALLAAGLNTQRPLLWVIEGVFIYLPHSAVEGILKAAASVSASQSCVIFDVCNNHWLRLSKNNALDKRLSSYGTPWIHGLWTTSCPTSLSLSLILVIACNHPAKLLHRCGWTGEVDVVDLQWVNRQYGRKGAFIPIPQWMFSWTPVPVSAIVTGRMS